jgi:hypothetical protein
VVSYPRCSIVYEKGYLHTCFPSQEKVSIIDYVIYPMGAHEPFLSPIGLSNLTLPLEYDLIVCETLSHGIGDSLSLDFLDNELPLDEAILEAAIMDF